MLMDFEFFRYFLVLLVPGLIGALAYSLASRRRTDVNIFVALVLDLFTFATMLIGLYYGKHVYKVENLLFEFTCLHFTTIYITMTIGINIIYGMALGFFRRLFIFNRS